MRIIIIFLLGVAIGAGGTWYLTQTEKGRELVAPAVEKARGVLGMAQEAAGDEAGDITFESLAANAEAAARRAGQAAQDLAVHIAGDASIDDIVTEAEALAARAGGAAGAAAIRGRALALAAAEKLPETNTLGDTLEGWQRQLAAYEVSMYADDLTEEELEATDREMASLFSTDTRAAPKAPAASEPAEEDAFEEAEASLASATARFAAHETFYKCPVIEVSNSGPVAADRSLTNYTPWIETPAGVLIRAPVETGCLSSGYGDRMVDGEPHSHAGVDYYNREGGTIYAAGDGVVIQAGEDGAYGYSVRIDHGAGVVGLYAHMVAGSLQVHEGDHVTLGHPIGRMGQSGRAYATHLHYELRFADATVDPLYDGRRGSF